MSAVEWVGRHAGGCLIETPHLEIPAPSPTGRLWRWAATLWPDAASDDGWAALEWEPGERGWHLPVTLTVGDVVEFGVTWHQPGHPNPPHARWYGWLHHVTPYAVVLVGGYPHPDDAYAAARLVVDEIRLDQLAPIAVSDTWTDRFE